MQTAILGIDYGSKRTGLALAIDARAEALETVATENALERIKDVVAQHGVQTAVVGLPRNLEGDDTAQTASARDFAARLRKGLGIQVLLQDEAVTSELAKERLAQRGIDPERDKGAVDAEAAAIILQDYLDSL